MSNIIKSVNATDISPVEWPEIIRPELQWFARQMEAKLQENDHKQHWYKLHQDYLIHRLYQEAGELQRAIRNEPSENIVKEAADVALFAMMIADNAERMTPSWPISNLIGSTARSVRTVGD